MERAPVAPGSARMRPLARRRLHANECPNSPCDLLRLPTSAESRSTEKKRPATLRDLFRWRSATRLPLWPRCPVIAAATETLPRTISMTVATGSSRCLLRCVLARAVALRALLHDALPVGGGGDVGRPWHSGHAPSARSCGLFQALYTVVLSPVEMFGRGSAYHGQTAAAVPFCGSGSVPSSPHCIP